MDFSKLKIGYVPFGKPKLHPFDLRNFVYYANKRNINFKIADPNEEYDVIVLTPGVDVSAWSRFPRGRTKLIYISVDAYLAVPRFDLRGVLRGLAKFFAGEHKFLRLNYINAIKDMCKRADAVICATLEQQKDIQMYCKNTHIILEFHQNVLRDVKTDYVAKGIINLVWEGRPETVRSLRQIKEVLVKLNKKYPLVLHVITDLEYGRYMSKFQRISVVDEIKQIFEHHYHANTVSGNKSLVYLYQWNRELLSTLITACDIAVIPLDDTDALMHGKPENKLVFFWRAGLPTVVSAAPAYVRTMEKCKLPLYCRNEEDWYKNLEKLIIDSETRKLAGIQGKEITDTLYSEEQYLKQWDKLFQSVWGDRLS
jgi:glycosyltransferase involved in cell wall biosynthesis